jgi:chromosome segregation ATPase
MDELTTEPPVTSTTIHPQASEPEELREEYHDLLRELAMALVEAVLAPPDTSESLERLLVVEEEIASLTGTIALAEQNFDRIRYEYSQREKRLRYAIMDLSMEQAKLEGLSAVDQAASDTYRTQIADLVFQIGELSKSCKELEEERAGQIRELDHEVKDYRQTRMEMEKEVAEIIQALHAQVETLRATAATSELMSLYDKLDTLKGSLDRARQTAG